MRRRLLQLLTALSLLPALATAGLWGRSYWRSDVLVHRRMAVTGVNGSASTDNGGACWSHDGLLVFQVHHVDRRGFPYREFSNFSRWDFKTTPSETPRVIRVLGFGIETGSTPWVPVGYSSGLVRSSTKRVQFPHWLLVLLFSLLPVVRVIRWQLRRRRAQQLGPDARPCPSCGYDRRATPTRCPECGHATHETVGDELSTDEPPGDEPPSDQAPSDEAMGRPLEAGR